MNESQRDRWIKYGGNVALTCVFAVALAVMATYAAERRAKRIDATASGMYSLKPQTVKIIRDLNTPIRLVSLYTQSKPPPSPDDTDSAQAALIPADQAAQTVNDLLAEYANKGKGITFETIDPVTSPTKVDDLIEQVEAKYGGEVKKYRDFVQSFKGTIDQISKIADPEAKAVSTLLPALAQSSDRELNLTLKEVLITVGTFPQNLTELQDALQRPLKQKPPDYKGASDAITEGMGNLSQLLDAVIQNFTTLQKRGGLPGDVAKYMTDSLPHYQAMKKVVDDSLSRAKQLGELKLDTLRSALRERNAILVMGDKEWRAIGYDQVWQPPGQTASVGMSDTPPRPRFAGEQQVTSAILALSSGGKKPKVAIVRAGGQPLAQSMSMMGGDAPMSDAAGRLMLYNFDVVEKDLTGTFAAQSGGTEPSDADIKDATWVVWGFKGQPSQFGDSPSIAPQVAAHLKEGGSAVILTGVHQEGFPEALADWGLTVRTDAIVVHEKIPSGGGDSSDVVEQVLRLPFVFDLHEYGDHPLGRPLGSLEGLFANLSPVTVRNDVKGVKITQLLPVPTAPAAPRSWGTINMDAVQKNQSPPLDSNTDVAGPIFAGAAVEKFGAGRLVVLAAGDFADNRWLELSARQIDPNAPPVLRFPGNGELFTNSVFWAARQDTLIDISPASMDIGRIADMSPATLRFWRVGVLLIGMPGLALAIGAGVYLKRRD